MASALSTDEKYALFQILQTPWNNAGTGVTYGYWTLGDIGTLASQTSLSGSTQAIAQTQILSYLDDLHTNNSTLETSVQTKLQRWNTIGSSPLRIESGAIGDINGVTYDYREEKRVIEEYVKWAVPFFRWHEVLERKNGMGSMAGNGLALTGVR